MLQVHCLWHLQVWGSCTDEIMIQSTFRETSDEHKHSCTICKDQEPANHMMSLRSSTHTHSKKYIRKSNLRSTVPRVQQARQLSLYTCGHASTQAWAASFSPQILFQRMYDDWIDWFILATYEGGYTWTKLY